MWKTHVDIYNFSGYCFAYRISANSFRGNYSFLNLTLCMWPLVTVHRGAETIQYSREETIQGGKLFAEIRYTSWLFPKVFFLCINQMPNLSLVGFQTRWDSATFWDKGTEVSSLFWDKGTTRQAQNLATGWDGPGQHVKIQGGTFDSHVVILSLYFCCCSCLGTKGQQDKDFFFHPRTKEHQDVLSWIFLGRPAERPVPWKP